MAANKKIWLFVGVGVLLMLLLPKGSRAAALIKQLEEGNDPKLKAYLDPAGKPTIGYGSTWNYDKNRWVQMGDTITRQQAENWLQLHINEKRKLISDTVTVPLNNNQMDSLVSLVYNIGSGAWKGSTFLSRLNARENKIAVADEFLKWVYITNPVTGRKVYSRGLENRRKIEKQIFVS